MKIWEKIFPQDSEIIIWGAGFNGKQWFQFLQQNRHVKYFIDSNPTVSEVRVGDITVDVKLPSKAVIKNEIILISPKKDIDNIYTKAKEIGGKVIIGEFYSNLPKCFFLDTEDLPFVPIGHYYSLYCDANDIEKRYEQYKNTEISNSIKIDGIDINDENQMKFLQKMNTLYDTRPYWELNEEIYRYKYENTSIGLSDTLLLNFMLRIYRPQKYVEVGSGYSSAAALDTNEFYLDGKTNMEFIEPYPDLLYSLLKESDKEKVIIHPNKLQDIPLDVFKELQKGDILFIDSTHVAKSGSDVNYLFFHIFPCLKSGVVVHLHDIFYPWDYPKEWVKKRGWNEMYLLRAFLQYNDEWEIIFFNNYMANNHRELFHLKWQKQSDFGGGSFWMIRR